ncbi:MAG: thermostable hemolysin [Xanthomonadales bacterium]|nr:thermostable hemolysin [Xanthomonadales bacterium]
MTAISANLALPEVPASLFRLGRLLNPCPAFDVFLPETANRHQVTQYIADQFKSIHGANIHDFMPMLLSMQCQGQFSAVSGVRPAARQPLFLEQYLGQAVETVIRDVSGMAVERSKVVEIGNLVSTQKGASQLLFLLLTALLYRCDYQWVVFTGTPAVVKGLQRLGFKLDKLGAADPAMLKNSNLSEWGSYYQNRPRVVAGNVPAGMKVLQSHKLYAGILELLESQIDQLAPQFSKLDLPYGTHALAA